MTRSILPPDAHQAAPQRVPRRTVWDVVALAGSALALLVFSVGLARSALFACGFGGFGIWMSNCPNVSAPLRNSASASTRLAGLEAESEQLERQLRQARDNLGQRPACPPEQEKRANAQPVRPTPAAPASPPVTGPAIDNRVWSQQEVAALEGCWELSSDYRLRNVSTNVVSTVSAWSVCLEKSGRGTQKLIMSDNTMCEAPIKAGFPSADKLELQDEDRVKCNNGTEIFRRDISCVRQSSAVVQCESHQPERESGGGRSNVTLKRR